jgi:hypothetical protein
MQKMFLYVSLQKKKSLAVCVSNWCENSNMVFYL